MTIREELRNRARKNKLVALAALVLALGIGALCYWRGRQGLQTSRFISVVGALVLAAATHLAFKGLPCPKCGVALTPSKDPPDFCPACGKDLREPTSEKPMNPIK
jgi:hypothetical protein